MKKAIVIISCLLLIFSLTGCAEKKSERIIGYSALYSDELINKAFDVIEENFSKSFRGCTLIELRYDSEVENKFGYETAQYEKENNKELIVVLSTFKTDKKGGDGSLVPNYTYIGWQWRLVRTEDKNNWEIIDCGY